jgi:hypothetical protein
LTHFLLSTYTTKQTKQRQYLEFPGWSSKESINTYISRVRDCLQDEQSKLALDKHLLQEAVEMLFQKFVGRYRPAIAAVVCQLEMTIKS